MCGEHIPRAAHLRENRGSSPHVRGTRVWWVRLSYGLRFIPACAGNTVCVWWVFIRAAVHPRMCGEHRVVGRASGPVRGSSPHVRGTPAVFLSRMCISRFIPACAGNTLLHLYKNLMFSVHPRMCGEHPSTLGAADLSRRFIPACAGNTVSRCGGGLGLSVHPRMCGEHGSIPREQVWCRRFIPACAGNTSARRCNRAAYLVHPRMCGEHDQGPACPPEKIGSSPHVRGTRSVAAHSAEVFRFIPACAGNTR